MIMKLEKYKVNEEDGEIVTFYNEQNKPIGLVDRQEGIQQGLLLEAVQLWIINPNTNQILMQRRSKNKKNNPNKIDVSVAGHVREKETPLQTILREAKEEIGIDEEYLLSILQKVTETKIDLAKFGRQGRYITHIYIAFSSNPIESYRKQDEEVDELFFMEYEELKKE